MSSLNLDPYHVFCFPFTLMKRLPCFPSASSCLSVSSLLLGLIFGDSEVLNLSYEHNISQSEDISLKLAEEHIQHKSI